MNIKNKNKTKCNIKNKKIENKNVIRRPSSYEEL